MQKFWQVFNNIPGVEEMESNISYHLMREEYRPMREDPVHKAGGAWRLKCLCKDTVSHIVLCRLFRVATRRNNEKKEKQTNKK